MSDDNLRDKTSPNQTPEQGGSSPEGSAGQAPEQDRHSATDGSAGQGLPQNKQAPSEGSHEQAPQQEKQAPSGDSTEKTSTKPKMTVTRRQVLALAGCGVAGLIVGGAVASWGVTSESIAAGRVFVRTTPLKMIVTDRARCSGCQRCEMSCTIKNDDRICQNIARVRVWPHYQYGDGPDTPDGVFGNMEFTLKTCKQCEDPWCMNSCPVHAIYADKKSGARLVDTDLCIACGMCHAACPWNMPILDPVINASTKCVSCGRCADQCPNGAIKFVDWKDIAQEVIDKGVVSTTTLVEA